MKKKRKPRFVPTYSAFLLAASSTTEPLEESHRRHMLTLMWDGFAMMTTGDAPEERHWTVVSDCVNMMETIIRLGWAEDSGLLDEAIAALKGAVRRFKEGKGLRLDAAGIKAIKAILTDFEEVLASASARNMRYAHNVTERSIWNRIHGGSADAAFEVFVK